MKLSRLPDTVNRLADGDLKALLITGFPSADGLAELPSHISVLATFRRAALIAQVKALIGRAHPLLPVEAMELVVNLPG